MISDEALNVPLDQLPGVTPARRELLYRLGLTTVGDLLRHFPRSYENLTDLRPIAALTADAIQTVQGEVVEITGRELPSGGTAASVVLSDDGKNVLEGVWFNQPYATRRLRYGQRVSFSGKPRWYCGRWQMANPRVQVLEGDAPASPGIVPVYPMTVDLRADVLRTLIHRALSLYADQVVDILPEKLRVRRGWPEAPAALRAVHRPSTEEEADQARRRFAYEDLLLLQVGLGLRRREVRDRRQAPVLCVTPEIDARIRRLFPFRLTADQDQAVADICTDMASDRPMQRLVQADVGAGKTAIAVYALLLAVANGHQAALMAPTEVLARQHAQTLARYLAKSRVRQLLLTGALTGRERHEAMEKLRNGQIDLIVGTQALVQEGVAFARLGLVVIDEQHKFGVHQRAKVRRLGADPHYLVMTATPIPRTVALTVFGDLDVSLVRQLPPGRQPVTTRWLRDSEREGLYRKLCEDLAAGRQGYVVCPLVTESESVTITPATTMYKDLAAGPFRGFRIGLLHGRLNEDVKADVMERFRAHQIDLLVSTSVIEVGVDVPNATWMVIEHAERFGLSQLHQLRGRVSRGTARGHCYLFADSPTDEGRERLRVLCRTTDGFILAEEDARLRGTGEMFGARQHGSGELAELGPGMMGLIDQARRDAFGIVSADSRLTQPEHAALRRALLARYGPVLELAEVG